MVSAGQSLPQSWAGGGAVNRRQRQRFRHGPATKISHHVFLTTKTFEAAGGLATSGSQPLRTMQKISLLSLAVGSALARLPLTGRAAVVTLNGDDTNSPVFNRTTETGAASFQNPHFDAYLFTVDLAGSYNSSARAITPATACRSRRTARGRCSSRATGPDGRVLQDGAHAEQRHDAARRVPEDAEQVQHHRTELLGPAVHRPQSGHDKKGE